VSALWRGPQDREDARVLTQMTTDQLDAVMAVEDDAYPFPWTRGNFVDSLAAGHSARTLWAPDGRLLGYFVAMAGVDEMHLLNITVAPQVQGQGHAGRLFSALTALCTRRHLAELWLEVRISNVVARAIYAHWGFVQVGVRKGYYPAPRGRREDAAVMSLKLVAQIEQDPDALV
jgi:ribosomal-protein-alanine N-acetyltransferase